MRICCTALVYEPEADHARLRRMLDSTVAAGTTDFVIAVDSKSAAGTDEWIRGQLAPVMAGDIVVFERIWTDDFGEARQATLERMPPGVDWWYWTDSDDVIERPHGALLPTFLANLSHEVACVRAPYISRADLGVVKSRFVRERLVRASLPVRWVDRIHETVKFPDGLSYVTTEEFMWRHEPDDRPRADRNGRLIDMSIVEEPLRARHWRSRATNEMQLNLTNAADALWEFMRLRAAEDGRDTDDKCEALIDLARLTNALGDSASAIKLADLIVRVRPDWPEGHLIRAQSLLWAGEYEDARAELTVTLRLGRSGARRPMSNGELDCNFWPHLTRAELEIRVGDYAAALRATRSALRTWPLDGVKALEGVLASAVSRGPGAAACALLGLKRRPLQPGAYTILDPLLALTDLRVHL